MTRTKRLYLLEYAALRFLLLIFRLIPLRLTENLVSVLGWSWYHVDTKRRTIAKANILKAGITDSPRQAARIARRSFQHFGIILVEAYHATRLSPESRATAVELDIPPETMALLKNPNLGYLAVTGHIGNWEIAGQRLADIKPLYAIARKMNNPYVNDLITRQTLRGSISALLKYETSGAEFISILRNGNALGLMADQHARLHGMWVPFFGHPARTLTAPARLHFALRVPVCVAACIRTGFMRYRMISSPPMFFERTGNKETDTRRVLETVNQHLESLIRRYPEQYLWAHRRWKPQKERSEAPARPL
jgi:KDO2-lipid IV(A) lauroyltransferase